MFPQGAIKFLLTTLFVNQIICDYLGTSLNYQKPKRERNNIVNKAVWIRNKDNGNGESQNQYSRFFEQNTNDDLHGQLQTFEIGEPKYLLPSFQSEIMQQIRKKRDVMNSRSRGNWYKKPQIEPSEKSKTKLLNHLVAMIEILSNDTRVKNHVAQNKSGYDANNNLAAYYNDLMSILKESVMNARNKGTWPKKPPIEETKLFKTKLLNHIAPMTENISNDTRVKTHLTPNKSRHDANNNLAAYYNDLITILKEAGEADNANNTYNNGSTSKRSMQYDFETEVVKHFEYVDENKTEENRDPSNYKNSRNVFEKSNSEWHQNAPVPDINVYRVVPKEIIPKSKPVTERGLIKVISMLSKSIRKIMKQYAEISAIHNKIREINDDFTKTTGIINSKFKDFDLKYLYLVKLQEKLKDLNTKTDLKEEYFKKKEAEMSRSFSEFENQQKKFLQQQKQFYSMQKLMLAQNEKINMKQSLIAKTQGEISHRQNNFARMLKKVKQLYIDRAPSPTPTNIINEPPNTTSESSSINTVAVKPVKVNAYPTSYKFPKDPDELMLREKDQKPIDDLIYKYYFNNTFLDSIMQKHILNGLMGKPAKNSFESQNLKRRDTEREKTMKTILSDDLEESDSSEGSNRAKRWITHHSKHNKRKNRGKDTLAETANYTDAKQSIIKQNQLDARSVKPIRNIFTEDTNSDPFLQMAIKFCIDVGQNETKQTLNWCVEKTLRRLQFLQPTKATVPSPQVPETKNKQLLISSRNILQNRSSDSLETIIEKLESPASVPVMLFAVNKKIKRQPNLFKKSRTAYSLSPNKSRRRTHIFSENNRLKFNIKKFLSDSFPDDSEGNVYYEGSRDSELKEQGY